MAANDVVLDALEELTGSSGALNDLEAIYWGSLAGLAGLGNSMRVSYIPTGNQDLKQTLVANNTAQTIVFDNLSVVHHHITADLETGVLTFAHDTDAVFSISAQVIREVGGGDAVWVLFVEVSEDGINWTPVDGSSRRMSFTSQDVDEYRFLDLTASIRVTGGTRMRFRHGTNDASKGISIIAQAATGGAPSSAGVIVSLFTIN